MNAKEIGKRLVEKRKNKLQKLLESVYQHYRCTNVEIEFREITSKLHWQSIITRAYRKFFLTLRLHKK